MSGWVYPPWRSTFYPPGLRQADELEYASRRVTSIEINGSFYSLQKPDSWHKWSDATPDDFVFSVKAPRFITHIRKLEDVREPLANFFASGILALGAKLGAILWQLPPGFDYDPETMEAFLDLLPHNTREAEDVASQRSSRMAGRELLTGDANRPIRHAIEPRSHSFDDPDFARQLESHNVAAVLGDSRSRWPRLDWVTADFAYARLHGESDTYPNGYDDSGLDLWEEWIRDHLDHERDVYAYFDTENKVHSPHDAMNLLERMRA